MAIKSDIFDGKHFLDTMRKMQESVHATTRAITEAFDAQVAAVEELTQKTEQLAVEIEKAEKSGNTQGIEEKKKAYDELSQQLEEAKKEFVDMQQAFGRQSGGGAGQAVESAKAQLTQLKNEITALTLEYRSMSEAERNSAAGQELQRKLDETTKKAATLSDAFADANRTIKSLASDTKNFDALAGGINLVTSAFGGVTGAAAMFGAKEEELAEIQTKLQASLAISNSLSVIQNQIQKESALMTGIATIQKKAENAATLMSTKGTIAATAAQKAFNLVAKANPYVLLATAILTVVGALAAFTIGSKKAKQEEEERAKQAERSKAIQEAYYESYNRKMSETLDLYRQLQYEYLQLKSAQEKTQWIQDNTDKFHALGWELDSIQSTENVFANNTTTVIRAFDMRAKAAAYAAQITKLYNDALAGQDIKVGDKISGDLAKSLWGTTYGYTTMVGGFFSDDYYITQKGVNELNRRALDDAEKQAEQLRKEQHNLETQASSLLKGLGVKEPPKTTTTTTTKSTKPTRQTGNTGQPSPEEIAEKKAELELKNQRERERAAIDLELSTREAEIQAMKEGTDKTIKQIELDRDKELEAIKRAYEDIKQKRIEEAKAAWDAEPNNKKRNFYESDEYKTASSDSEYTLDELENKIAKIDAAWHDYFAQISALNEEENQRWLEYEMQYGDYQQKRLAITEKYNKQIAESSSNADKVTLSQQMEAELEELDKAIMESSGLWSEYFGKFESRSNSAIRGVMKDILDLIDYMNGVEGAEIPDIFAKNEDALKAIQAAMQDPKAIKVFTDNLKKTWETFKKMIDADNPFKVIANAFKADDNEGMAKGFKQIADAMGQVQGLMSQIGISADSTAGKITSTIGNTASLAAQGAQIGGVYGAAAGAALGIAQGLVGAFGADYSQYQKLVEEYTNLINVWDTLIEKKKEYISESYGVEAAKAGKEAESLVNKEVEAWRRLGRERLNAGASAGSHSIGVRIRQQMTAEDWRGVGYDLGGRLEGLFDLSAKQLEELRANAPGFWAKLDDDVRKYLENIIKGAETLEDIQEKTRNQLTSTSFDSVYDSFLSSLSDMDKSAYDFSKDFEKYMFNAVLNAEVGNKFKERLKTWYANFAESTKGGLSDDELAMLKAEYDTIVREGVALRDELAKVTGYGSSGEGDSTFKSVSSFTQEQGDVLNGRLTAIQIAVQNGNLLRQQMVTTLGTMSGLVGGSSAAMDDMRDLMAVQNTHLEDIVTLNKRMLSDFGEKMDRMNVQLENKL